MMRLQASSKENTWNGLASNNELNCKKLDGKVSIGYTGGEGGAQDLLEVCGWPQNVVVAWGRAGTMLFVLGSLP